MKKSSLRFRLLWRIALLLTMGLTAIAILAYTGTKKEGMEIYDAQLAHFAKVLASLSQDEIDKGDRSLRTISTDNSKFITPYEKDFAYRIWFKDALILQSDNAVLFGSSIQSLGFTDRMTSRGLWRFFVLQESGLVVEVGEDYETRRDLISKIGNSILMPLLLMFPLLLAAIWCGVRYGISPLDRLQERISNQQPEALSPIDLGVVPREISGLVQTLNSLIVKVENVLDREKRFTSYAAHELRTPLAALRTQIQVALRTKDTQQQKQLFGEVIEGLDRMGHLVHQLLVLVRAQNLRVSFSSVPISDLALRALDEIRPLADEKHHQILCEITPALYIDGDTSMLSVLLRNLLDNAVRYSPDGATISVKLNSDSAGVTLNVENTGVELSEEQCQRIFEPFYRGKENLAQGSGLGLSIVAWIVKQHVATIRCTSKAQKLSVVVHFPSEKYARL